MQKSQKGFTLIELVVVIVLLGILGVTALARFQDLGLEAQNAANSGIASELSAGSAINLAAVTLGVAGATPINGAAETCVNAATNLLTSGLPGAYTITGVPADCSVPGTVSFLCAIDHTLNLLDTAVNATVLCTP